ncbi:Uncharacterised protein [Candidatus Norongarragalina meridionalis]|nr:Uncharacterised protein [Candidatus Norongarragalina meridionalis]
MAVKVRKAAIPAAELRAKGGLLPLEMRKDKAYVRAWFKIKLKYACGGIGEEEMHRLIAQLGTKAGKK